MDIKSLEARIKEIEQGLQMAVNQHQYLNGAKDELSKWLEKAKVTAATVENVAQVADKVINDVEAPVQPTGLSNQLPS